jgi:guanine deaminase
MHEQFLCQAIALATANVTSGQGGPFGAVVVKNGQALSACSNQVTATRDPTAHAEVLAIRMACNKLNDFQLTGCVLYTSCEPCPMCLGAIYWARLDRVYFASTRNDAAAAGFDDSFIYEELPLAPPKRRIAMLQLAVENAAQPFAIWNESNSKVLY